MSIMRSSIPLHRRFSIIAVMVIAVLLLADVRVEAVQPPAIRNSMSLNLVDTGDLYESEPIEATATIAGLTWTDHPPRAAWIRARTDGGDWGQWEPMVLVAEHEPDPGSPERLGQRPASEPTYLGPVDWIQFRVDTDRPSDVGADVIETAGRTLGTLERIGLFFRSITWGSDDATGAPNQPDIVPREAWGGPSCNPDTGDPSYTDGVRMMFVHHTTTYNTYPAEDVPGIIFAMCSYHVDTRGWKDIGYNFVIDRFGTIYEARAGGIEEPVWGAHTGGFNYYSSGVALIGDHDLAGPSQAALDALNELLAWKLDHHHVDANATVTVESLGSSLYLAGEVVDLATISGHLDASATSCPGDFCYPLLPGIRPVVADIGGAKIYGGLPNEVPPVVTEDVIIPFTFTEEMTWSFRLLAPDGAIAHEANGTGTTVTIEWDGMIDGEPGGRGAYDIELDATTTDDGEVPTPVREQLQWYEPRFADDDFNRHQQNINLIADAGITEGCSSVLRWLYCPDSNVRRDQMASFLARALNLPPASQDYFSDDNGNTHEAAINSLAEAGITNGCANDRYCPLESIRRDHMAVFIARALDLDDVAEDFFDDDDGRYEGSINAIAQLGITLGCGEREFCPDDPVARDQMASFLARAFLDAAT